MTSDQCTAVRKVNANASCTIIHTTKMSDFIPTKGTTGMVALTSCPTGDLYFDDYYTNVSPVAYQLEMTSAFHWSGNCGQPSGFNGPYCWVNFSDVTMSNQQCYYWHSGQFNATEAKDTIFVGIVGIGYTAGEYRGCNPSKSCYWGWI